MSADKNCSCFPILGEPVGHFFFAQDPIKPHEKRALNFLSHEYLMQQDLKLTAITLTEENGDQVCVGGGRGREGGGRV